MIYIDYTSTKIVNACQKHYDGLIDILFQKIDEISDPGITNIFNFFINPYLDTILTGKPDELLECHERIQIFLELDEIKTTIKKVFKYKNWFDVKRKKRYEAYNLAENLDIPTCVYCNRMYTKTVSKINKLTRPTFDHWFSKDDYPLLALSFYNLIPSCNVCNSGIKGSDPFNLNTHFHPYYKSTLEHEKLSFKFSFEHKNYATFSFKIHSDNHFSETSTEAFKLKEIYAAHEDEINDLRTIRDNYSETYLKMLRANILKNVSDEEIYRLAFGTYFEEEYFDRRPLSKMKKDILEELGIIIKS
jgi:hypothetical protein